MKNNKEHPGWQLSRDCIRDTMLAKRSGALNDTTALINSLYAINIRALRDTQLAPYQEVMREGRYLEECLMRKAPSDVVIVIRGGMVEEVRSNNPYTSVWIADYDDNGSGSHTDELEDAEERGNAPDMHVVYN